MGLAPLDKKMKKLESAVLKDLAAEVAGKPTKGYLKRFDLKAFVKGPDVRAARRKTHRSQPEFAQALGVSHETLRSWETGRRHPRGLESKIIRLITQEPEFVHRLAEL